MNNKNIKRNSSRWLVTGSQLHRALFILCIILFGTLTMPVLGQSVNAVMTLYKDGFALIKQPVAWQVPAGKSMVKYDRLPAELFTDSPFLTLEGATVLNQRMDTDLFSGDRYFAGKLGETVEVKIRDDRIQEGILLEYNSQAITLQKKNELMRIAHDRIDYIQADDQVTNPLFRPVLSWVVQSERSQKAQGELVYLTGGFAWSAIYRLIMSEKEPSAVLIAEAVISNRSNIDFSNLQIKLVEGKLHRSRRRPPITPLPRTAAMAEFAQRDAAPAPPQRETLGDYHIYTLPERVALESNESLTVRLYTPREVTYEKTYLFENSERSQKEEPLEIELKITNTAENNLNIPLPQGKVELYFAPPGGSLEFAGEDELKQVPKGGTATLIAGRAFDVVGKRKVLNYDRQRKSEEASIEIRIKNGRDEEIKVKAIEHITGDWVIRDASTMYIKEDATTIYFPLTIPANETQYVTYTYRKEWK
jgi:hypothetical protein